jgi:hypothetical protein
MSVWKNVTTAGRIQVPVPSFLDNKSVDVGGMFIKDSVRLQKHLARAVIVRPQSESHLYRLYKAAAIPTIEVRYWE